MKNCVVHSSSFSYLLSASFGPAGPILVASSLRFFFNSCIFTALVSDDRSVLFCKLRSAPSRTRILAYPGDLSFSFLCCFVLSIRYPFAFSFILCHAQTNTLLIFVAIACNFHEAPLLPFFLYRSSPKFPPLYLTWSTWYATIG